jgi:hypothetical protein
MAQTSRKSIQEAPLGPLSGVAGAVALLLALLPAAPETLRAQDTTPCVASDTAACLLDGRFEVSVVFRTSDASGEARVMSFGTERAESDFSVFFWFFDPANFEMGVKMVDACVPQFDRFWVFVSGLTNQEFTVAVRDSETGQVNEYFNPLGTYPQTVGDTDAFPCP